MKIERKFYQKRQEELERMEKEIQEVWNKLSQKEREEEEVKQRCECQQIIDEAEFMERHTMEMPVEKRIQLFKELGQEAVCFAENLGLDVLVESDDETKGTIMLKGDMWIINSSCFNGVSSRHFLIKMILEATDFWITAEDGLVKMECAFRLSSPVYIKI